jgi:tetratricopeptide (TPR) repeat protein
MRITRPKAEFGVCLEAPSVPEHSVGRPQKISRPVHLCLAAFCLLLEVCGTSRAQNASAGKVAAPNAVVTADSLPVYSGMSRSGPATGSLKKGDAVIVGLEIQTTERWCSVRLPSQESRLGYVPCQGLERIAGPASTDPAGSGSAASTTNARPAKSLPAKAVSIPSPSTRIVGYDRVAALVVHGGAIDVAKIAEFDSAARDGSSPAMARAALAHFAAGKFELAQSSIDEAIEQFRSSLSFSESSSDLQVANLLTLAQIDLARSQYSDALEYLGQARRLSPRLVAVAQLSGWAHYGLNQIEDAIKDWQAAQQIAPNAAIGAALAKAERDRDAESETGETNSAHFILRYQGSATPTLAAEIIHVLEEDFRSLESEFRFTPAEPIGVVLYTEEAYREVSDLPAWARAENDGRIRVPVQGVTSVTNPLSYMLMHELVHSFIRQKTLGRCPTWLNEGLAQWFEGRRSDSMAAALIATFETGKTIPLQRLEGSWATMSGPAAQLAYARSLATVEYIMSSSGMYGIERLFERFDLDPNFETAMRGALQTDYADLERQTAAYLQRAYGK